MTVKCTERYSPSAGNPSRDSSHLPERAGLDRGHYGGIGHRSSQRRLTNAFDLDTLESARTPRDGAPVPLFLAGHDPLRVLRERKYREEYAR